MLSDGKMNIKELLKEYLTVLKKEDIEALASLLDSNSTIYTPLDGLISGRDKIKKYIIKQKDWLNTKNARVEIFNIIDVKNRVVIELNIFYDKGEKTVELPFVIVLDIENNIIINIRIYHSTWPTTGKHSVIKPLLKPDDNLIEPEIITEYMKGLKNADKDLVLSLFEEDAYVQEPSGSKYKHTGKSGRNNFYSFALDKGGVSLKHCTATFDGRHFAVEYVFDEWGDKKFEPQAGIAIYEIGESGKLAAVRIYDDASPPG
jgi:hypothetical protein